MRLEVAGHAEVAAPGVSDLHIFQLREQLTEQITTQLDFIAGQVKVVAQLAGELITTAGAENQTVVSTALAISDLAAEFAESLAATEADLVPRSGGQRFSGDDQALHRQLVATQWRQCHRVTFHRRHDPATAHIGFGRAQTARLPMRNGAVFVNLHAHALHGARQAAHQFGRVNGRHMRGVDATVRFGDTNLLRQLLRAEPAVIVVGQTLGVEFAQVVAQSRFLFRIARRAVQHAALAVIAVDTFTFEDDFHFIGDAVQQIKRRATLLGRQSGEQTLLAKQIAHQPAAVAPGCAKPGGLRLDNGDVQARRVLLQVVRRPQPRVTGADNRHVDVQIPLKLGPRDQRLIELIHPQTDSAPRRHARLRH
ncbi:hypothetical protein SRM1_02767 [Pseudomonas fluorescens]|nr:hypothetical protein SRM1_02767 [Pseudomonas fluorescens]